MERDLLVCCKLIVSEFHNYRYFRRIEEAETVVLKAYSSFFKHVDSNCCLSSYHFHSVSSIQKVKFQCYADDELPRLEFQRPKKRAARHWLHAR